MQQYKSQKNIEIERNVAEKNQKFRGEIPFEVEANISGKIINKFPKEFESEPIIFLSTIVAGNCDPFLVSTRLSSVTKTEFSVDIQNAGDNKVTGIVRWAII